MKNVQLPALTSLRFFAALMVFFSHLDFLRIHEDASGNPSKYQDIYKTWFYEGYSGVTFFFILSGFILAHSYQERLSRGTTSTVDFFIFRIARIVPLHWLTLLIAIFLLRSANGFPYFCFRLFEWDFFKNDLESSHANTWRGQFCFLYDPSTGALSDGLSFSSI